MGRGPPPPEHTRWKPGQSGNPAGGQKLPDDIRKARKLTTETFLRLVTDLFHMSAAELDAYMLRKEATMLELMVGGILQRAAREQDYMRANFLLDRTIGKVSDKVQIELPKPFVITRTDGAQLVLGASLPGKMQETIEAEVVKDDETV